MKSTFVLFMTLIAALGGCAVASTGVVPRGEDMYTVTRQGEGGWVTTDSLKTEALREADAFCTEKKKKFKFIHSKEIPAGVFGRWPESEVLFKCE